MMILDLINMGALSYFVNEEWKHKVDEKIYSQSYHKL